MLTDAEEQRLIVISDLHLGNPYSRAARNLVSFIDYIVEGGYSLCINGDGVDILQGRLGRLTQHGIEVMDLLKKFESSGGRLYYIVGNHDIVLERALHTWISEHLSPFLNVRTPNLRIRIEHGHTYDAFYVTSPRMYEILGIAATPFLHVYPDIYRLWSATSRARVRAGRVVAHTADEYATAEQAAAAMIANRGFDVVVFGHTHRAERVELGSGATYFNSGNWLRDTTFVQIADDSVSLLEWRASGPVPYEAAVTHHSVKGDRVPWHWSRWTSRRTTGAP
jgi:UDP-2,3-diacylglucosamine pyrophosphatase LpxH